MTITWNFVSSTLGADDNLTVTIEELDDGVATGKSYAARIHKIFQISKHI